VHFRDKCGEFSAKFLASFAEIFDGFLGILLGFGEIFCGFTVRFQGFILIFRTGGIRPPSPPLDQKHTEKHPKFSPKRIKQSYLDCYSWYVFVVSSFTWFASEASENFCRLSNNECNL